MAQIDSKMEREEQTKDPAADSRKINERIIRSAHEEMKENVWTYTSAVLANVCMEKFFYVLKKCGFPGCPEFDTLVEDLKEGQSDDMKTVIDNIKYDASA